MKEKIFTADYASKFSDEAFMDKVARFGKKMGAKLVFNVYVLYYVLKSKDVPIKVKGEIVGALGYVIVPLDLIPDFIPVAGFTDDLAAITFAVQVARAHLTPDILQKAKGKVYDLFGSVEDCELNI